METEKLIPKISTTYKILVPIFDLEAASWDGDLETSVTIDCNTLAEVKEELVEILANYDEMRTAVTRYPQTYVTKRFGYMGYIYNEPTVMSVSSIEIPLKDLGFR